MNLSPEDIKVVRNADRNRFEATLGGHTAVAEYMLVGDRIVLTHTEVPEALKGKGIGSSLARTALEFARERQLKVMPLCPYMAAFIRRHPEYKPLLLTGFNV